MIGGQSIPVTKNGFRRYVSNYVNGYAVQSLAYSLPFDARSAAGAISVPVLIVHSEKALAPDLAHAFINYMVDPTFYVEWATKVGAPASANSSRISSIARSCSSTSKSSSIMSHHK